MPRNQRHGKTSSRFTASAVSAHPVQTASILWQGCIRHLALPEHSVSIRGLPKDWRRPPGRPPYTWLRTLEADLQPVNLGLNSAWKYTQDREHWKHLVESATLQLGACSGWWWCILMVVTVVLMLVLRPSSFVCLSSVPLCIVANWWARAKITLTAYRKSHMRNRLVPWMIVTFIKIALRSCQSLRHIHDWISRKTLQITR